MSEEIEVEARFETDGSVTPLRFRVGAQNHTVTSVGRAWDVAGEGRHILVMDERQRVYELLLEAATLRWRLAWSAGWDDGLA
jgi:hypothetical protein